MDGGPATTVSIEFAADFFCGLIPSDLERFASGGA